MHRALLTVACTIAALPVAAQLPDGYWSTDQAREILDVTLRLELDPDLSHLSEAERQALPELLAAGQVLNDLYEDQLHSEALAARSVLEGLEGPQADALRDIYYLSKGPVATTLDNARQAFVPVHVPAPGGNVYPGGIQREEIERLMAEHPDAPDINGLRTVVRRATASNVERDLEMLDAWPVLDVLHSGLRNRLEALPDDAGYLYAVPYALAYAPQLATVRAHLDKAADILEDDSPDFSDYLRLRSRDLLSGDYEAGNAAWVSGSFNNLNAQIGSYETYNDSLLGVKAYFSCSILARDKAKSLALEKAVAGLQEIEDALPYESHRRVRSNIPVGAYNIIADFGQSRGSNTATILPNDADHTRKYGRTILIRYNIISHPSVYENRKQRFAAVVAPEHRDDLTIDGGFERTLWHEIGHYLGVDKTADGRPLDEALGRHADLLEEMKSDLVSLFAASRLEASGYHDTTALRAHYASGIRRTLQSVKPRPEQPYQNMQLMQFNYYLEYGLIELDSGTGLLRINYDRYDAAVTELLALVLQQQRAGDQDLAAEFVSRWNYWDYKLHGKLADKIRSSISYRRTLVRYKALGD